jgi:hypothetical protein
MSDCSPFTDRRKHQITVEDLRRQLREADEERFRLTCEALRQMFENPFDRRRPRVGVQDIRRDLREADEDRFRLTMLARRHASHSRGIVGLMLFILVATGFVVRTAQAPVRDATSDPPSNATGAGREDGNQQNIFLRPAARLEPPADVETSLPLRRSSSAQRRRADAPARIVPAAPHTPLRVSPPDRGELTRQPARLPASRPSVPRPLHPGEFGR